MVRPHRVSCIYLYRGIGTWVDQLHCSVFISDPVCIEELAGCRYKYLPTILTGCNIRQYMHPFRRSSLRSLGLNGKALFLVVALA